MMSRLKTPVSIGIKQRLRDEDMNAVEEKLISREKLKQLAELCSEQHQHLQGIQRSLSNGGMVELGLLRYFSQLIKGRVRAARIEPHRRLLLVGAQDALNHPVAFIGYLDGYEERSRYRQELMRELGSAPEALDHVSVLVFVEQVLLLLERSFVELSERESLYMGSSGPTKPGPERTFEVAHQHLVSLGEKIAIVVLSEQG
jgi:hypothetical protein